jgi:hypothetical protein
MSLVCDYRRLIDPTARRRSLENAEPTRCNRIAVSISSFLKQIERMSMSKVGELPQTK